jgi:hypothetical protein
MRNETKETNQNTIPTLRHMRTLWTARPHEKLRLLLLHHAGMDDSCTNDPEMLCAFSDERQTFE